MEVDLMELKDNILSIWKARDKHKTSSLGPTFVLLSARAGKKKKSTLGDTFSPSSAMAPAPICQSFLQIKLCCRWGPVTPHKACGPATRDLLSLSVHALWAGCSSHPRVHCGDQSWDITLIPWWDNPWGQQCHTAILSCHSLQTYSSLLPSTWVSWTYHPL